MNSPSRELERSSIAGVSRPANHALSRTAAHSEDSAPFGHQEFGSMDLADCWRAIWSRKYVVIAFAVLGIAASIIFNLAQSPVYRARLALEILQPNENFLDRMQLDASVPIGNMRSEAYVETQIRILQSDAVARRVMERVHFARRMRESDNQSLFSRLDVSRWYASHESASDTEIRKAFASDLLIAPLGDTRIIEILFDSPQAALSADAANALAAEFILRGTEMRAESAKATAESLARPLEDLNAQLNKSDRALKQFASSSGMLFASDSTTVAVERLKSLQQEISKAQADLAVKDSRRELAATAPPESLPDVLSDPAVVDSQRKLADLRREDAELAVSFTLDFYKVKRVRAEIAEVDSAYKNARNRVLQRIEDEAAEAKLRDERLLHEYAAQVESALALAGKQIQYDSLKREAEGSRALYMATLQRVKEATIASAMGTRSADILDYAEPPSAPYKPHKLTNSLAIGLPCLFAGVVLALLQERSDRRFRHPADTQEFLNLEVLGAIAPAGRRRAGQAADVNSIESIRSSFLAMQARSLNGNQRVFVVSSPQGADGKTTVVAQLGIALAQIGKKVLLVDGDLRRPQLHRIFGIPNDSGVTDLARNPRTLDPLEAVGHVAHNPLPLPGALVETDANPEEVMRCSGGEMIQPSRYPGLYVLPSGVAASSASAVLTNPRIHTFLKDAGHHFDIVLIDTPPGACFVDARVFARSADGVILVFRAGRTSVRDGRTAAVQFIRDGAEVVGAVLNDWKPGRHRRARHYY